MFDGWKGVKIKYPYYLRNGHLGNFASTNNPLYFDADQLFNLIEDPRETKNIFKENKENVEELKKLLIKSLKSFPQRPYGEFTN